MNSELLNTFNMRTILMSTSLNLVVLRTNQIKHLKEFYENLLELKFEKHLDHGPMHYGASLGDVYFEIYPTQKELGQLDSPGFIVENLDKIISNLEKEHLHKEPKNTQFGRIAIIKDPDNRLVYLTERSSA